MPVFRARTSKQVTAAMMMSSHADHWATTSSMRYSALDVFRRAFMAFGKLGAECGTCQGES
jgi:hypothetical protein